MAKTRQKSGCFMTSGIISIILGIFLIAAPVISSFVIKTVIAWVLIALGIVQFKAAFHEKGWYITLSMLFGILMIWVGIFALRHSFSTLAGISLALSFLMLFGGALFLGMALDVKPKSGWKMMMLAGLAQVVLAMLVLAGWPANTLYAFAGLVGLNFMIRGVTDMVSGVKGI